MFIKRNTNFALLLFFALGSFLFGQNSNAITVTVSDSVYHTIGSDFFGIQYHSNTYSDPTALNLLKDLNLKPVRVWAEIKDFHPEPGVWEWNELDTEINEITASGFEPVPCLWGEEWFIGSEDTAWWNYEQGLTQWDSAACELAKRYAGNISRIIVFDELNMLHPEEDYYIPFKEAAQLYIRAAQNIKTADPDIRCGGPSSFGGWENGYWAHFVLDEPNGPEFLDFISSNTFLSWDAADSDHQVLARTIWYEEAPQKIREMLGAGACPELVLDAYNLSALWTLNGQPWTDPRNTNIIGGIYQAAALLHSAKGGFDITLHWETIGGYGVLNWYPQFKELAPYYSWKFLIQTAGLSRGAQLVGCTSDAAPDTGLTHLSGAKVESFDVQPFALRRSDGNSSVVLINKAAADSVLVRVRVPSKMKSYALFRFDEQRTEASFFPLTEKNCAQTLNLTCPPYSVTTIRFDSEALTGMEHESGHFPKTYRLFSNFPNPFNSQTMIRYQLPEAARVTISVFDARGRFIQTLVDENKPAGKYRCRFNASGLASGMYYYQMKTPQMKFVRKGIHMK